MQSFFPQCETVTGMMGKPFGKKVATIAVITLTVLLIAFALIQIGESGTLMSSYCSGWGLNPAPFVVPW